MSESQTPAPASRSETLTRYDFEFHYGQTDRGRYVKYAEVEALEARLRTLEGQVREIAGELRDWQTSALGGQTAGQLDRWATRLREALIGDPR